MLKTSLSFFLNIFPPFSPFNIPMPFNIHVDELNEIMFQRDFLRAELSRPFHIECFEGNSAMDSVDKEAIDIGLTKTMLSIELPAESHQRLADSLSQSDGRPEWE